MQTKRTSNETKESVNTSYILHYNDEHKQSFPHLKHGMSSCMTKKNEVERKVKECSPEISNKDREQSQETQAS